MRNLGLGYRCGHRVQCKDESHSLGLISIARNNLVYPCTRTCDLIQQVRKPLLQYSENKNKNESNHSFLSTVNLGVSKVYSRDDKWVGDCRRALLGLKTAVKSLHLNAFQWHLCS